MTRFSIRLLTASALLSLPVAASAHRQWIIPSATVLSGTHSGVTFDAASSTDLFFPDHRPMQLNNIKVWAPDGSESKIENASTGAYRSTFDVKIDKPGTWKVGSKSSAVSGTFMLNGEERRVGGRPGGGMAPGGPAAGQPGPGGAATPQRAAPVPIAEIPAEATDIKLTQSISRYEVFVTSNEPTTEIFKPSGDGLEFEPVTHPDELVVGETAKFRFLVDGRPAGGVKVIVAPGGKRYRNDDGARELTTAANGELTLNWPEAGLYWLNATLTDDKPSEAKAQKRRMSYSMTLEVLQP